MFKLDSPFMNFMNKVADIMILNFLVVVFCMPIVTAGAAFSAAYYISFKMVKNEESYIVRGFWKAFKENFKQATIMWLIVLAAAVIIFFDYYIILYSGMEFSQLLRLSIVAVTVLILLGLSFLFPMQARFENTVKNTIRNSFLMALSHLPTAFLLIVVYAVPIILLYFIPQTLPVLIVLASGGIIYFKSFMILRVFKKYEEILLNRDKEAENNDPDSGIFAESDRMEQEKNDVENKQNNPTKVFQNGKYVDVSDANSNLDENS